MNGERTTFAQESIPVSATRTATAPSAPHPTTIAASQAPDIIPSSSSRPYGHLRVVHINTQQLADNRIFSTLGLQSQPSFDSAYTSSIGSQSVRSSYASSSRGNASSLASRSTQRSSIASHDSIAAPDAWRGSLGLTSENPSLGLQRYSAESKGPRAPQPRSIQYSAEAEVPLRDARSSTHDRWCTKRDHDHRTPFKTYDGLARHEKEHDERYVFLPHGPVETSQAGQRHCALCGLANPTEIHLEAHDILKYCGVRGASVTRSRKANFEELLRQHNTSEEMVNILVSRWKEVQKKTSYSCGFCIHRFSNLPERTRHIDQEHFAKGKHIDEWNDTFVIKGLLKQTDVKHFLRDGYGVDLSLMKTKVRWPDSAVDELQLRLELGTESAKDLATAALTLSTAVELSESTHWQSSRTLCDGRTTHSRLPGPLSTPAASRDCTYGLQIPQSNGDLPSADVSGRHARSNGF